MPLQETLKNSKADLAQSPVGSLGPGANNGLVPNWERSLLRLYIVTLLIQHICKMLDWMKHKLELRLP